jgi:hypothetical protein
VYIEQQKWMTFDNLLANNEYVNISEQDNRKNRYWLKDTIYLLQKHDLDITKFYSKPELKEIIKQSTLDDIDEKIRNTETLQFLEQIEKPHGEDFDIRKHKWWLRTKVGSLHTNFLLHQNDKKCFFCDNIDETITHFALECKTLNKIITLNEKTSNDDINIQYWLSKDRSTLEKTKWDSYIYKRWNIRENEKFKNQTRLPRARQIIANIIDPPIGINDTNDPAEDDPDPQAHRKIIGWTPHGTLESTIAGHKDKPEKEPPEKKKRRLQF